MSKQIVSIPGVRCLIAIVVLAAPLSSCWAQTRLSVDEAVRQALEARPLIKAEAERVTAAEAMKVQAGLRPNPEFQFQEENLRPGQTYSRDVDTLAFFIQPLDILGKRKQRIAAARETVTATKTEYELARWRIAQSVKLAYWQARGAQEIHDALLRTIDNFGRIVNYTQAQFSVGDIAEQDLMRVRLEGERLKITADLAAIDFNHARVELLRQMGRTTFSDPVTLTEVFAPDQSIAPLPIKQVLGQRIDVAVARAALSQGEANAKLQDVLARPDLSVTYGYKRTQLPDAITGVNTALAAVTVSIPISDRNQGNRAAAAAELRRRQDLLAEAEAQARADYAAALEEYQARKIELTDT
ncbi:MAG: TolC family protein, partial [Bryobacteraceae bacterium]